MNLDRVAKEVRALLLPLSEESRRKVLYEIGICDGCGVDKMDDHGDIHMCHCRNDE